MTFHFTIDLLCSRDLSPADEDALFDAGCDDATLVTRGTRAFLNFSREAASLTEAIESALANIQAANLSNVSAIEKGSVA